TIPRMFPKTVARATPAKTSSSAASQYGPSFRMKSLLKVFLLVLSERRLTSRGLKRSGKESRERRLRVLNQRVPRLRRKWQRSDGRHHCWRQRCQEGNGRGSLRVHPALE